MLTLVNAAQLYSLTPAGKVQWEHSVYAEKGELFRGAGELLFPTNKGLSARLLDGSADCGSKELWRVPWTGHNFELAADDYGVVANADGTLYAVSSSGSLRWKHKAGDELSGTTAEFLVNPNGDVVCVVSAAARSTGIIKEHHIVCYSPEGKRRWDIPLKGEYVAHMALWHDQFIASVDSQLRCYGLDGKLRWKRNVPGLRIDGITIDSKGTAYVAAPEFEVCLYALDDKGRPLWSQHYPRSGTQDSYSGRPLVVGDSIYLGTADIGRAGQPLEHEAAKTGAKQGDPAIQGRLLAIDPATGNIRWTSYLPDDLQCELVADPANRALYTTGSHDNVFAFRTD